MSEPTQGPWHYQEESDAYTHIVRGPNNEFILSAPQGTSGECEANARLAASAPKLLETLETIADFAVGNGDVCEIIAKRARAAIRSATHTAIGNSEKIGKVG